MVDRTIAPEIHSFVSFQIKQAQSTFLENGTPVHYLVSGTQPIIRIEFIFPAGTWFEPVNGLSYLASKMLLEGTSNLNAKEIADKIALYGAFIETHQGFEHLNVTLYLLEKHLGDVLYVVDEIFSNCIFPDYELQNAKSITKQTLKVNIEKNQFLASVNFRKQLFGENHPYGRQYWENDIENVERDEIIAFSKQYLNWSKCEIFISGKFSVNNVLSILNNYTSKKNLDFSATVFEDRKPENIQTGLTIIEKPKAIQSSIKIGCHTISRSNPDFIPFLVVNEILGGFFGSRLMKNIREDKGFTYGIHSSVQTLIQSSYFVISTDVKKENTDQTLSEINKEIDILKSEYVTETELRTVTSYMSGRFINSLTTPFALMDKFKTIYYSGLDYNYYNDFTSKLSETTPEDVNIIAGKYLKVDTFTNVVVGSL